MAKLKLKSKVSEWEILPDDIPIAQDGKRLTYQWSNQQPPSNYTLATPKDVNVSRTESNKKLTPKEIEQLRKYTAEQNQLRKEQEYNQRKQAIQQSIEAQKQPLTIDNLRTQIEKGTYFTRDRQNQEADSKQFGRKGKKDYFDKKTGKLLGTYKTGGKVNSDWELID